MAGKAMTETIEQVRAALDHDVDVNVSVGQGVVYFIQMGEDGPIKIGYCSSAHGVISRVLALQGGSPYPLYVRRVVLAIDEHSESALHAHFAKSRMRGEWFKPTKELAMLADARSSRRQKQYDECECDDE